MVTWDESEHPRATDGKFAASTSPESGVRLDEISDDEIDFFTSGMCHALAGELHRRTGWPMVAVVNQDGAWTHMGVRHPDGSFFDIEGRQRDEDVVDTYGWGIPGSRQWKVVEISEEDRDRMTDRGRGKYEVLDWEAQRASAAADALLRDEDVEPQMHARGNPHEVFTALNDYLDDALDAGDYQRSNDFEIAIDLWDGMMKGRTGDELVSSLRHYRKAMLSNEARSGSGAFRDAVDLVDVMFSGPVPERQS